MIDILFLIAGVWAIIAGKLPESIIRLLFGKGQYNMSPTKMRLIGLLLVCPLPATLLLTILIPMLFGKEYIYISSIFEIGLVVIVSIAVIIIFRTSKVDLPVQAGVIPNQLPYVENKESSYGNRLMLILGIVALTMLILGSCPLFVLNSLVLVRNFSEGKGDLLFYLFNLLINILVMGFSVTGIVKLVKKLQS